VTVSLRALANALDRGDPPSFEWVVAHVVDGSFQSLWDDAKDPRSLFRVYAHTGDRRGMVRAACACARTAIDCAPAYARTALAAIEVAEAWCRGEADESAVRAAANAASAAGSQLTHSAEYVVWAAVDAVDAVYVEPCMAAVDTLITTVNHLLLDRRLAPIVRSVLPTAPRLDQLFPRTP